MKVLVIETQRMVPIGTFASPLLAAGLELVHWRVAEGDPPASISDFAGVIALGGGANPDEDELYPWLGEERAVLRSALAWRMPTIGLCLGAQLLAQELGASVARLPRPEVGWAELTQRAAARHDPLCARLPRRLHVFQWHRYAFDLPPAATLLAGSARATEAFSWAGHAWGLQFHLEASETSIGDWIAHYDRLLEEYGIDPRPLTLESEHRASLYRRHASTVARAFARLVTRSVRAGGAITA